MKIMFVMRHSGYMRNYHSTIKLLTERGHNIHLVFGKFHSTYSEEKIKDFLINLHNVTFSLHPASNYFWYKFAVILRLFQNYLRFFDIRYREADKLRKRAESWVPRPISLLLNKFSVLDSEARIWSAIRCLRLIEHIIPNNSEIEKAIKSHMPDVLLITPLVDANPVELDWLKSAKSLGISTGLC